MAWQDDRSGAYTDDIYAQRLSRDGALLWGPATGLPVAVAPAFQSDPRVIATAQGPLFTWTDSRSGAFLKIYAQRMDRQAHAAWAANGIEVCGFAANQFGAVGLGQSDGSCVIAWLDGRTFNGWQQVMAQRLSADGAALGPADGLALSGTASPFSAVRLLPGGAGTLAMWSYSNGGRLHLLAQSLDTAFTPQWATNGLLLFDALDGMGWSSWDVESDGADGMYTAASVGDYGNYDIVAERFSPDGAPLWPGGVTVRHGGDLFRAQVTLAHSGADMITAWGDYDATGGWDLAANLVGQSGLLAVPPARAPSAGVFFAAAAPSPVRAGAALTLRFVLPRAGDVDVTLLDIAGRALRRERFAVPAGESAFPLPARNRDGALAPGMYWVRASSEAAGAAARRVVVLR